MTTKIYTKTGDAGDTGLFGGGRVGKDHPRVEAYGDIDELNAVLGMARSVEMMPRIDEVLVPIQRDLFAIGALLATPNPAKMHEQLAKARVDNDRIAQLERAIDDGEHELACLIAEEDLGAKEIRSAQVATAQVDAVAALAVDAVQHLALFYERWIAGWALAGRKCRLRPSAASASTLACACRLAPARGGRRGRALRRRRRLRWRRLRRRSRRRALCGGVCHEERQSAQRGQHQFVRQCDSP